MDSRHVHENPRRAEKPGEWLTDRSCPFGANFVSSGADFSFVGAQLNPVDRKNRTAKFEDKQNGGVHRRTLPILGEPPIPCEIPILGLITPRRKKPRVDPMNPPPSDQPP